jgi:peptide/nickel transport system permease protein
MLRYVAERLLWAASVLLVVSLLAFSLQAMAPGDPARLLLEASGMAPIPEAAVSAKRAEMRLDEPLPVRYLDWVAHALRGDFGRSFRSYQPVLDAYLARLPATAALAGLAGLIAAAISLPLGVLAAYRRGRAWDALAQTVAVVGASVPGFWMALVLIVVFSASLRWLPAFGSPTPSGIVLPAVVVALPAVALLTRLVRSAVLDALAQDFVQVARAKGLRTALIARRHVLPNALVPVLTVLGLELANLLTGAAVVEYVFGYPGVGKLAVDAVLVGDMPIVVGFAVAAGLVFVLVNLVVDLCAAAIDPRVRAGP